VKPENSAVFILSAGLSVRYGEVDKLMENLGGKPLLAHAIDTAKSLPFAAFYGIVPHSSQRRRDLFHQAGFNVIDNPSPEKGQGLSLILAAQKALAEDYEAICILLGDMPFIASTHLEVLMEALYDKESAISACNQTIMPPLALRRSMMLPLAKIRPEAGAKTLLRGEKTTHIPLSNQAAQDIDDPEIMAWLNEKLGT